MLGADRLRRLDGHWLACCIAVTGFAVSEIFALAGYLPIVLQPGEVLAIEAIALIAITISDRRRDWRVVGLICLLSAIDFGFTWMTLRNGGLKGLWQGFPAIFECGLGCLLVFWRIRKWGSAYILIFSSLVSSACLFIGAILAWSLLDEAVRHLPIVYDPILYRFDAALDLNSLYQLGFLLRDHPLIHTCVLIFYKYNLVFAAPAIISEAFYSGARLAGLPLELLISSFLVFPIFCLVPALAPAFFFGSAFPAHLPVPVTLPLHSVSAPIASIRNTFPSLHASWALLCCIAVQRSPVSHRLAAIFYAVAIFVATIGFGEHYVVDWAGAMGVVLVARAITLSIERSSGWLPRLSAGFGILGSWVFAILYPQAFLSNVVLLWFVFGFSIGLPIYFGCEGRMVWPEIFAYIRRMRVRRRDA